MATIGRGAAVVQTHGGRTLKGKTAALAWGAVHLALLSTGEDRAKAIVDWTWAGFTHDRPRPHQGENRPGLNRGPDHGTTQPRRPGASSRRTSSWSLGSREIWRG